MPGPSLEEGIKLIRSVNGLAQWSDEEIERELNRAINNCAMTFTRDKEGKLNGLCFGFWRTAEEFHVTFIVGNLYHFVSYLKKVFPRVTQVTGYRNGVFKTFNLNKFCNKS